MIVSPQRPDGILPLATARRTPRWLPICSLSPHPSFDHGLKFFLALQQMIMREQLTRLALSAPLALVLVPLACRSADRPSSDTATAPVIGFTASARPSANAATVGRAPADTSRAIGSATTSVRPAAPTASAGSAVASATAVPPAPNVATGGAASSSTAVAPADGKGADSSSGRSGPPNASTGATAEHVATATAPHASVGSALGPPAAPASEPADDPVAAALARLPFKRGERLEYQVKYGILGVGSAVLEVLDLQSVRGIPTVHTTFNVKGGVRVYRVDDRYESWFEPRTFATLRAVHDIDQGSYERERHFEIFPDRKVFVENDKPEAPTVAEPLDEGAFIFFLRTLPLEVGKTYEFQRYFRPDRNPVRVTVVRRERVKVPAGEFQAIVVRPTIKTSGIFGEGGRAEVWFSDDSARTLVQLKSQLKFGSLNLFLKKQRLGTAWTEGKP